MSNIGTSGDVVLIPVAVRKEVFVFLTKFGAKKGKTAATILAECFQVILNDLAKEAEKGEVG